MTELTERLSPLEWLLAAAIALIGAYALFDTHPGINWAIWVALAVMAALFSRRSELAGLTAEPVLIGIAAILAAGAAARTSDINVHVGIAYLTAVLLGAFLRSATTKDGADLRVTALITSPFSSLARVAVSAPREIGLALRAASDSPTKTILRRVLLVAPVVLVLLLLLGGADPVIHSAIQTVEDWFPLIKFGPRAVFFAFLFIVLLGACSRLPGLTYVLPPRGMRFPQGTSAKDVRVLVGSTLATLVAFLILQAIYLFVQLPDQPGTGVTYAEYARRGFGQLCVVVTIVAAVILFAEKFRDSEDLAHTRTLRKMEFALIVAAGLILLSAQHRVILYEQAYGYTIARVHATAYIIFIAGFLVRLALELRGGQITPALGRRSSVFALVMMLFILYWNDQAWIMDRNIDRVRTTGKFDAAYAASLSPDAFPTLAARKNELPPGAWDATKEKAACVHTHGPYEWFEWNPVRSAAEATREALHLPITAKCSSRPND
jgi:hypothetical protein